MRRVSASSIHTALRSELMQCATMVHDNGGRGEEEVMQAWRSRNEGGRNCAVCFETSVSACRKATAKQRNTLICVKQQAGGNLCAKPYQPTGFAAQTCSLAAQLLFIQRYASAPFSVASFQTLSDDPRDSQMPDKRPLRLHWCRLK